jgi:peptidoglycan hydrolase-like protein with peptidoglycan-binding domain
VAAVAAAVLAVGAIAEFGLITGPADEGQSGNNGGRLPPATAQVIRQTLVDTQTEDGKLSYGDTTVVAARLSGTVTALPAAGAIVQRGQAIYRIDDAPVVLLYGTLPSYRTLASGTEGADVKQFEQNLSALGYKGFTVDDTFSGTTTTAVKEWQDDLGLPQTGTVEQGRVVYAGGPARVDTLKMTVGVSPQPGADVLTYTGSSRVVIVDLDVADQRLARKDAAVTVVLPDGKTATGKIARTRTVIDTGSSGQSEDPTTKIEVTVSLDDEKALDGLDQATMDVKFTVSQRENVLTVPVAVLLALTEGGYGVQVVEGAATRIVKVETGLFAGGQVEISGSGVAEGMTVGMPS